MGLIQPEEVTLPCRFLTTTAHFVLMLCILLDAGTVVVQSGTVIYSDTYYQQLSLVQAICYAAMACFAVEYICLFLGVSIFFRALTVIYALLHFSGTVTAALLYAEGWPANAIIPIFVLFSGMPTFMELMTLIVIQRSQILSY